MADLPSLIIAIGTPLGLIGGGIRFMWNKVEKRFVAIEAKLDECRHREDYAKTRVAGLLTVIELLWQDIRGLTGGKETPAQRRARRLLDGLKLDLPPDDPDLTALAMKLDDVP